MELNTAEQFLVLIHHPEKTGYLAPQQVRNIGLTGSILLDLAADERITLDDGKVKANSLKTNISPAHQLVLEKIYRTERQKKIKNWIAIFNRTPSKYYKPVINGLDRNGLIRIEHKKFLFISYMTTRLINNRVREGIIKEARDVIFRKKPVDDHIAPILGLIEACKIHRLICRDRSEIKSCRSMLREITKEDGISRGVAKVIQETQAAVLLAMTASTAAVVAASR